MARRAKWGNKRTVVDGIPFDSKKEANRYQELKLLERAGLIRDLELQPPFELLPSYVRSDGKRIRGIVYKADFRYFDNDKGETVIEDVKGVQTDVFKIKRKLLEHRYPDIILLLT